MTNHIGKSLILSYRSTPTRKAFLCLFCIGIIVNLTHVWNSFMKHKDYCSYRVGLTVILYLNSALHLGKNSIK